MDDTTPVTFESGFLTFSSIEELQKAWERRQWELNNKFLNMHRDQHYEAELSEINTAWKQYFRQLSGIKS